MARILIIDDKADNLTSISATIKTFLPNQEILTSSNGIDGIKSSIENQPDVILLDIFMPKMDGFEVCKKLKSSEQTKHIPIIMLTAYRTDNKSKSKGLELGADAFLLKPFDETELIAQIKVMIRIKKAEDQLREEKKELEKLAKEQSIEISEKHRIYSTLVSNLPGIAYQCLNDENWTMLFLSDGCFDLTGYQPHELINNKTKSFAQIILEEDRKAVWDAIQGALNSNTRFALQYRIKTKSGEIKWLWEQGIGIYDEDGELVNLEGFMSDISEQKTIEQKLIESEEKHRSFIENSLEGLYILKDGKMHYCNNKLAEIFGYEKSEDVVGLPIPEFIHPESFDLVREKIRLREEGIEKITHYEFTGVKKDGSRILLETLGGQIFIKGEVAIQGALRDITKQRDSEEQIRKLSRSVDQSPTSIVITDLQGKIEYVNPKFISLTGYSLDEVRGRNANILKSGHTPNEVYRNLWRTITNGNEWKGEILNKKKNGELYWEQASISPIKNNEGIITHFVGIKEDITERKNIEEELIKAKEKAEESDKLKTSFLANMSHEIRTPMNAIMGFSSLLSDSSLNNEERNEFVKLINNNSNNLLNLIDDIIDIAKIEAGQLKITNKDFNIIEVLDEIYATYKEINNKENEDRVELILDRSNFENIKFINTDPHRIKQVLANLIGNAIKYTEKGEVSFGFKIIDDINVAQPQKRIQFYVRDTGIGIPTDRINIIFDRFRQADDSHTRIFGGTGLGLAISKNIANLLQGDINVVSTPEKGSVFYFTIPLNTAAVVKPEPELTDNDLKSINWAGKTVLIVEDVESNFYLLETFLKRSKINILWAQNGNEAIKEVDVNKNIDLILMDMQMPVLNGFEATKTIKSLNEKIPIIAVTAFALQGDKNKIMKSGCNDYISKPVKSIDLYSKMSKYL